MTARKLPSQPCRPGPSTPRSAPQVPPVAVPLGSRQRRLLTTLTNCSLDRPTRWPPPAGSRRPISLDSGSGCRECSREASGTSMSTTSLTAFGLSIERVGPTSAASTSSTCSPTPRHSRTSLVNTPGFCGPTTTTWAEFPIRHPTPVYPHSLIWHQDNAPRPYHASRLSRLQASQASRHRNLALPGHSGQDHGTYQSSADPEPRTDESRPRKFRYKERFVRDVCDGQWSHP